MITDQQALLAAILEAPEDDTLRLVYADCIEELGQVERAEFIRVQIELAKPHKCPKGWYRPGQGFLEAIQRDCDWCESTMEPLMVTDKAYLECRKRCGLRWREKQLFEEVGIDVCLGNPNYQWDFWSPKLHLGMVRELSMTLADWIEVGESLVREQPIQKVVCTDKEPSRSLGTGDWVFATSVEDGKDSPMVTIEDTLPKAIAVYLKKKPYPNLGKVSEIRNGDQLFYYPSQQAALDDLSQALIRWAKSQSAKQSVSRTC